jgi:hypothetical protein
MSAGVTAVTSTRKSAETAVGVPAYSAVEEPK